MHRNRKIDMNLLRSSIKKLIIHIWQVLSPLETFTYLFTCEVVPHGPGRASRGTSAPGCSRSHPVNSRSSQLGAVQLFSPQLFVGSFAHSFSVFSHLRLSYSSPPSLSGRRNFGACPIFHVSLECSVGQPLPGLTIRCLLPSQTMHFVSVFYALAECNK
jgi:hypothetical protein